mmetsp:Transcript_46972/g.144687  ORF Transcript_46972/g.144687 Transcript_46972/m.144687 type:complete len:258 (-) Transcript_46972:84-857(-)
MSEGPLVSAMPGPVAPPPAPSGCAPLHSRQPEKHCFGARPQDTHLEVSVMYISARLGCRFLMSCRSAPASIRSSMNLLRLDRMATQRAFQSEGFAKEFTEAPRSSSVLVVGSSPLATAYIRGVQPLLGSRQSTEAPSSSNAVTASVCFRCAASKSGGHPLASVAFNTSTRLLSSEASPSKKAAFMTRQREGWLSPSNSPMRVSPAGWMAASSTMYSVYEVFFRLWYILQTLDGGGGTQKQDPYSLPSFPPHGTKDLN